MSAAPLENHITPVPVCHSQERLAAAIARLSPQDDWLLLWDERPVGALPVATLCHRFLSVDKAESQQDWRQFLDTPIEALLQRPDIEQRLQPLQLIPVFWSQQDLQSYLKHSREAIAQFQWVVVDADQQPLGLLKPEILWQPAALNDEAARRVMELTAQQATLQQTWQLNNDYLAYLSHELKNPITALLGLSELLVDLQSLPDAAKEESVQQRQQRYSQLIRHNSLKLAAIASDILDLSRIEQGHLSLTRQSVALRPLCHRAWQDVHTNTGYATQFRSRPASDPALPGQDASPLTAPPDLTITALPNLEHIVADEQRLLQMLTQLLVNARIATAFSGEVGVAIAVWGPWCAITVWDTGVGIAPEHQAKLLYSLQTLENPQTHSLEETGLGLVLTQRLAERQGGDVSFLSGP
ncbi:MAG: HAMP domain-containing sensor histidine kinase, partial [Cyanobacteria bacterium P01_A01_bin.135]